MRLLWSLIFNGAFLLSCAQSNKAAIWGSVIEEDSQLPIVGAVVQVYQDSIFIQASNTNITGNFFFDHLAIGRYRLLIKMVGFQPYSLPHVQVTSGKSTHVHILLKEEALLTNEVTIRANAKESTINEMASVSARQFDIQETERYAGSRGDPARMASNFAGVVGADDARNDIVIRGNSPQSVLWRIDGIDLPNPNHFNIPGTAGGPVSIINNKYLGNSDFYTGAFPAEFGNSLAGVFDLKFRNGNNNKHEWNAQLGFLGTEIFGEGPLQFRHKRDSTLSKPSYLLSYRYSTLQLFEKMGVDIGTDAIPQYQDGAFRLNWPLANNNQIAFWGIVGSSGIDILISDQTSPDQRNIYGQNDRDQYFNSRMMSIGLSWSKNVGNRLLIKSNSAYTTDQVKAHHELVYRSLIQETYQLDSLRPILGYVFAQSKWTNHTSVQLKFNNKWLWRSGLTTHLNDWNHVDSLFQLETNEWSYRWNSSTYAIQSQPYTQIKWKPNSSWSLVLGLHANLMWLKPTQTHFLKNNLAPNQTDFSASWIEPRASIKYHCNPRHSLSLGIGRHSQMQAPYIYTYLLPSSKGDELWNRSIGPALSDQWVIGWQFIPKQQMRILVEGYIQRIHNVPIDVQPSSFSLLNSGAGFSRIFPPVLTNAGTGQNHGVELTVEHFFHQGWLWLFAASLFDATYRGSDGIKRNTDFNNKFAINAVLSKEWLIAKKTFFVVGTKITSTGGRWYGPANIDASNSAKELVYVDSLRNTLQFRNYFRWDAKVNFKINRPRKTHEIGLDMINLLATKNVLALTYAPNESNDPQKAIREEYQLGFLPLFYYKLDF
jgi:hypothetical protein